jgi:hypothetical protein
MEKLFRIIATEARKALPPTLFFMAVFHIAMLIRHLDEVSYGITTERSASATIAALVFGKMYLLLGERRFMNLFAGDHSFSGRSGKPGSTACWDQACCCARKSFR